jgi:hypothetical protein
LNASVVKAARGVVEVGTKIHAPAARSEQSGKKESNGPGVSGKGMFMKKLIPLVLVVWTVALVGCTPTTETTTTTTQRQTSAHMDPTIDANRTERMSNRGPN